MVPKLILAPIVVPLLICLPIISSSVKFRNSITAYEVHNISAMPKEQGDLAIGQGSDSPDGGPVLEVPLHLVQTEVEGDPSQTESKRSSDSIPKPIDDVQLSPVSRPGRQSSSSTLMPQFSQTLYQTSLPGWPLAGTTLHLGIIANYSDQSSIKYRLESPFDFLILSNNQDIVFTSDVEEGAYVGPNNVMLLEVVAHIPTDSKKETRAIIAIVFPLGKEKDAPKGTAKSKDADSANLHTASHHHDTG